MTFLPYYQSISEVVTNADQKKTDDSYDDDEAVHICIQSE